MAKQMLSEVLEGAGDQKTKQDKIDYLRKNGSIPLQTILKGAYDDAVIWNLPEGKPPFQADGAPKGFEMVSLHKQCKKFKHFVLFNSTLLINFFISFKLVFSLYLIDLEIFFLQNIL